MGIYILYQKKKEKEGKRRVEKVGEKKKKGLEGERMMQENTL